MSDFQDDFSGSQEGLKITALAAKRRIINNLYFFELCYRK